MKKNYFITTCPLFLVFYHDIIIYIDFTRIVAASNTATDDITN